MMKKVSDLFYLESGNGLALNKLTHCSDGIAFVSRTSKNNGVSDFVCPLYNVEPFSAGLITVALSGNSVLESCVQPFNFYTGYHVMVLTPIKDMTLQEKIFYCLCIKENRFKYSFGRQANRTLGDLLLPDCVPENIASLNINSYENFSEQFINSDIGPELNIKKWRTFSYQDIFDIEIGKGVLISKAKKNPGKYPLVSATVLNNAVATYTKFPPTHKGNSIVILKNGINVGTAFYQPNDFSATPDVAVLVPKFNNNVYISMFLITIINQDKYRYNYGRKWGISSFSKANLILPSTDNGLPDWDFMNNFIKQLHYSKVI